MDSVSKSRLKAKALEYFRQIEKTGRELVVTDRGRPVLKIIPYRGESREVRRVLKGSVLKYDDPTGPVALEDWGVAQVIVLDTHVWVWWVSEAPELPARIKKVIDRNATDNTIYVSSISAWEVALLVKHGRLQLTMSAEDWIAQCEALAVLKFVPVDNRIVVRSVFLPGPLHNDLADRMIISTALQLGARLVTKDAKLRGYAHVETLW